MGLCKEFGNTSEARGALCDVPVKLFAFQHGQAHTDWYCNSERSWCNIWDWWSRKHAQPRLTRRAWHGHRHHLYCRYCRLSRRPCIPAARQQWGSGYFGSYVLMWSICLGKSCTAPPFNCHGSVHGHHGDYSSSENEMTEVQYSEMSVDSGLSIAVWGLKLKDCSYTEVWLTIWPGCRPTSSFRWWICGTPLVCCAVVSYSSIWLDL